MLIYEFTNPEDIPKDIPEGQYTTKVDNCYWNNDGDIVVQLTYIGEIYTPENPQCLFSISRNAEETTK